jgi:hypothetical protein
MSVVTCGIGATSANPGLVEKFIQEFVTDATLYFKLLSFDQLLVSFSSATGIGMGTAYGKGIDLDNALFNLDIVSNFVYQNRSVADDLSTSALDVDQIPLYEVKTFGKGTAPVGIEYRGGTSRVQAVDISTGVDSVLIGDDANALAEPSKGSFLNAKYCINTLANPGVVNTQKLKSHYRIKLFDLVMKLKGFTTTYISNAPTVKVRDMMGKYCYHWFRKTIDLSGSTAMNITYQHHWAGGCTLSLRKDTSTNAYVGKIQ